jgi:hypothetical protein
MSARVLGMAVALLAVLVPAPRALAACKLVKRFELPVPMNGLHPMVHAKINGTEVLLVALRPRCRRIAKGHEGSGQRNIGP